ncbi:MAG: DUF2723 domain-containing protein [Elusimicrobia bacterium]|nr:DUF2723 domain-containing protein [Elusimicrobiota bacterium]
MSSGVLRWERVSGRLLFLAGLAGWLKLSCDRLPYGFHDVHYLTSLEWGLWGPSEWVHPLFVPLLALYQLGLGLLGWHGRMFLPLELLNVGAAGLTMCLLFLAMERCWSRSWPAAGAVLLLGFSRGFWEASLRPDPYALAGLCSAACLAVLASLKEDLPRPGAARRFGLAGVAAGLAAGFHAAALALVGVALAAAWRFQRSWRCLAWFLSAMALVLGLCLGTFVLYRGVTPEYFKRASPGELFGKVEQMPGTSIYTSKDPVKQVKDYAASLNLAGGSTFLPVALLLLVLVPLAKVLPGSSKPESGSGASGGMPAVAGWANLGFYSAFFIINNSQNGFVYGSLIGAPFLLASWAPGARAWVLAAAALASAGLGSRVELAAVPSRDPMLVETRFLGGLLAKGDVVVVPGCPFPEMVYERRLNFVAVGEGELMAKVCSVPVTGPDAAVGRIAWTLKTGRKVYLAQGDLKADFNTVAGDVSGAQKLRQAFWTPDPGSALRQEVMLKLRRKLTSSFKTECGTVSPQGWEYCKLGLKPGSRSPAKAGANLGPADVELLGRALLRPEISLGARLKTRYLLDWLEEVPEDPYAKADLAGLAAEEVGLRRGLAMADADRILALVDDLAIKRPSDADKLVDRAEFYAEAGRAGEASAALKKARTMGLSTMGLRRAAWCHQSLNDCQSALSIWRELAKGRHTAKDLSDKAVCEFHTGDRKTAAADLETALKLAPDLLEAYVSLAAVHAKAGELRKALAVYDRGLAVKNGKNAAGLRPQLVEGRDLVLRRLAEERGGR